MRIISEFHDYYDSVQAMGQDQSLVYLRKEKEKIFNRKDYPFPGGHFYDVGFYTVGFCGKIYPTVYLEKYKTWCNKLEDVDKVVESNLKKKEVDYYHKKVKYYYPWVSGWRRNAFKQFFDECEDKKDSYNEMFIQERSPVFLGIYNDKSRTYKITFNTSLRECEFFRVVEPYTAFQEIQMFMSNLAVPLKPIPEISDKVMVEIKGFDKYSFRKPPKDN